MGTGTEIREKKACEVLKEWEKPTVKELDINAITLSGFTGVGADNLFYS
jgi:hypothetical protein